MERRQLTIRSVLLGLLGMLVITSSSMILALKMGTMPWPILFATILSMLLIGQKHSGTNGEVNVTETIMSSGAMVSAGIVFTLPGIWILQPEASIPLAPVLVASLCGVLLGILFSRLYAERMMGDSKLVFPIGSAAFQTISTGIKKGVDSLLLSCSMGFSALFAVVRDMLHWIPARLTVYPGGSMVPAISVWLSPMALSIGALINHVSAFCWFGGALFSYLVLTPLSLKLGLLPSLDIAIEFRKNLGIGLVIGTGVGVFLKIIRSRIFHRSAPKEERTRQRLSVKSAALLLVLFIFVVVALTLGTPLTFAEALLTALGAALATLLSGMLTGECGTNPLEVFGILVMLASLLLLRSAGFSLFLIAEVVSVACGLIGVLMNDLKAGTMLGTDRKAQFAGELIGALGSAVFATFMLFVIKGSLGPFGTDALPAPQANAVASIVQGAQNDPSLLLGIFLGAVLYVAEVPSATIGLGFYLPIHLSISSGIGALLSCLMERHVSKKDIDLVCSGCMGGEGVVGVIVAIMSVFK